MSRKLLALGTFATLLGSATYAETPRVATDIAPVHSLVARVMDGLGTPNLIIAQGASPHEYSLRPSEAGALQEADLVFWIGEDLTPWLEDALETLAEDAKVVELLEIEGVALLEFREGALFEAHDHGGHDEQEHEEEHQDHAEDDGHEHEGAEHAHEKDHDDHEHEDGHEHEEEEHAHDEKHDEHDHEEHAHDDHDHAHGAHDPHAWLSPDNAMLWLNAIAASLSAADPKNAGTYYANAAAGIEETKALSSEISTRLDPVRDGKFIVFHDAYQYFETAFDFPASGAISFSDASDPSPARVAEVRARVVDEGIDCVLSEPQFNQSLVATVIDGATVETAVIDPLGSDLDLGPGLYPQLMQSLANSLADCL